MKRWVVGTLALTASLALAGCRSSPPGGADAASEDPAAAEAASANPTRRGGPPQADQVRKLAANRRQATKLMEEGTAKLQSDPARARECFNRVLQLVPQGHPLFVEATAKLSEVPKAP